MNTLRRIGSCVAVVLLAGAVWMVVGCAQMAHPFVMQKDASSAGNYPRWQRSEAAAAPEADALPATLAAGEELWVIARHKVEPDHTQAAMQQREDDDYPGCGALVIPALAGHPDQTNIPVPLKHTSVSAEIAGYIATVDVTQQFHNPYASKIEAVYVFPLPEDAAINEFIMTIGERRIRGVIRERAEAERLYQAAKRQGYAASLLTQERPNLFTQKVANIEPGRQIDVHIRYFHTLDYDDGWYEFVFPMTVIPRYNPAYAPDPIQPLPRGGRDTPGVKSIHYLRPEDRSGYDIDLSIDLDAGVGIEEIIAVNHDTVIESPTPHTAKIELAAHDRLPNKDFVLRYRVAGDRLKANLLAYRDRGRGAADDDDGVEGASGDQGAAGAGGGYFTFVLYPPADLSTLRRRPMEMVFVVDCSGSMRGQPLAQAKAAMRRALESLDPDDTFQIVRFSNEAAMMGDSPVRATAANLARGRRYIDDMQADGGTEMLPGMRTALLAPTIRDEFHRQRVVTFMTDGAVGNEEQVLSEVTRNLGGTRIFSFGIGSSPNRYLLDRMAMLGRGAVAYIGLHDGEPEMVMDHFFERISHPALTDVAVDYAGMQPEEVYPQRIPDLFVGRPVVLTGRFRGEPPASIKLTGTVGDERVTYGVPVRAAEGGDGAAGNALAAAAIKPVWARMKIRDLANRALAGEADGRHTARAITTVALRYRLVSDYTAFIAVDASRRTEGEYGATVNVPVPVPEGTRYDTTVPDASTPANDSEEAHRDDPIG